MELYNSVDVYFNKQTKSTIVAGSIITGKSISEIEKLYNKLNYSVGGDAQALVAIAAIYSKKD